MKEKKRRVYRFGNDGYGSKNCLAKTYKGGVELTATDPHDWGRVSSRFYINKQEMEGLIEFLLEQVKK